MIDRQQGSTIANKPRDVYEHEPPERLQDDPLVSYFRCRYKERKDLMADFEKRFKDKKHKFERIKQELARIDELRSEFDSSHGFFMERLRTSRETWIQQAKKKCRVETLNVEKTVAELVKKGDQKSRELLSRKQYELNILERVPNISLENPSTEIPPPKTEDSSASAESQQSTAFRTAEEQKTPTVGETEEEDSPVDPDHGFMASMITLKKDSPRSSYVRFEMEKYPVNEALDGSPNNPLKQRCKRCEPDTIRYFHFPANNMAWIEVWPL
jgi:hypothetical protein